MADLTYFQKYPKDDEDQSGTKSMRIDHPDFGNVLRCVYAKGVITDFEKVADDPIEVKSRVKVRIGDEEYDDFIPLFFHPKAQYWDDPGDPPSPYAATDFNEEGKYFEKAWRSFRKGDEVAVLLQATTDRLELTPKAVIAFADGVPRIGEAVVKIKLIDHDTTETFFYIKHGDVGEVYGETDVEQLGPDGAPLKLELEAMSDDSGPETYSEAWQYDTPDYYSKNYNTHNTTGLPYLGTCACVEYELSEVRFHLVNQASSRRLFFFIGPLCVCFQYMWMDQPPRPYNQYVWTGCGWIDSYNTDVGLDCTASWIVNYVPHNFALGNYDLVTPLGYGAYTEWDYNVNSKTPKISTAIISKDELTDLLNTHTPKSPATAWDEDTWWEEYDGFTVQTTFGSYPEDMASGWIGVPYSGDIDYSLITAFVRPHSKEELITAEMWPKEEEA